MKALTLTQPWASLVALGAKTIETRSWRTNYRGPLAIHAAKTWTKDDRRLCWEEPFCSALDAGGIIEHDGYRTRLNMPLGTIVAVATLTECRPTDRLHVTSNPPLTRQEYAFGNYDDGRWGWLLADVRRLPAPLPYRGALGLWELPDAVIGGAR